MALKWLCTTLAALVLAAVPAAALMIAPVASAAAPAATAIALGAAQGDVTRCCLACPSCDKASADARCPAACPTLTAALTPSRAIVAASPRGYVLGSSERAGQQSIAPEPLPPKRVTFL